ncbi:MAG: BON domain-containing protein [Pseudomonadota bacterium]
MKKFFHFIALSLVLSASACTPTETRRSAGEAIDDVGITARVKAALIEDDRTNGLDIDVETFRGRVQLNGFVSKATDIGVAAEIAEGIAGVVDVTTNLSLEQGRTVGVAVDDTLLLARVDAAFARDPELSALDIDIDANNRRIRLSGFVDQAVQKSKAGRVASEVAGVESVDNGLEVRRR